MGFGFKEAERVYLRAQSGFGNSTTGAYFGIEEAF
jgi:hypothetical protein